MTPAEDVTLQAISDRLADVEHQLRELRTDVHEKQDQLGAALKSVRGTQKGLVNDVSSQASRIASRLNRISVAFDLSIDERFVQAARPLTETRQTLLGFDRLFTLWQAVGNVAHLSAPAVEIGTYRGGSAALIAEAFRAFAGSEREIHVLDTFEGHLDSTFSPHDASLQHGKFQRTSAEDVRRFLAGYPGIQVHQGDASAVIKTWPERQYSLVHLDVDLYRPTLDCLEYFGPRLVSGGIIVLDDYEAPTCPGVAEAAREYLAQAPLFQQWRMQPEQAILIKR